MPSDSIYSMSMVPKRYTVKSISHDTHDTYTLTLRPLEGKVPDHLPGQFNMLYHFGFGEIAISISGRPSQRDEIVHTIKAVGPVTQAMQKLKAGDEIGIRGPFGAAWPLPKKGGNLLVVAGGLGLAPLCPLMHHLADNKDQFKNITLLYGTRTPEDIFYKNEMEEWKKKGIEVKISVDKGDENWRGDVGVITLLIHKHLPDPQNTRIFLCGPEIMMKFAIVEILRQPVPEDEIYLSMERNMKCAVGFCGHCQYGPYFLCKDGPIFSFPQLKSWLPIKEL